MVMEIDTDLTRRGCGNLAGHSECAASVVRSAIGRQDGCPSYGSGMCTCRIQRKSSEEERARLFIDDPAVALRYLGHRKHERQKSRKLIPVLAVA